MFPGGFHCSWYTVLADLNRFFLLMLQAKVGQQTSEDVVLEEEAAIAPSRPDVTLSTSLKRRLHTVAVVSVKDKAIRELHELCSCYSNSFCHFVVASTSIFCVSHSVFNF